MIHIFDIALNDLRQLLRDRNVFLFLLIMPISFTLLFSFAFGGFSRTANDPRMPVGFLNEDNHWLSQELEGLFANSQIMRLVEYPFYHMADFEKLVEEGKLAAALVIPSGYGESLLYSRPLKLIVIADTATPVGTTVQSEALTLTNRLDSAVRMAIILEEWVGEEAPFKYAFKKTLSAWQNPPIRIEQIASPAIAKMGARNPALAHNSPGMMLQFSIAGLLTAAQMIVNERKSRALQRILTTSAHRAHILLGHYLAIFILILSQFFLLITFGQFAFKVDYLSSPIATGMVAISAALCIAALGLLIGTISKTEEQAIMFSLIPMFVLSGIGGAMVPLEITNPTFQTIGHLSPVAWAMDGFKNVILRGLGVNSVWLPCAALVGYATVFLILAIWRFQVNQET